MAKVVDFRARDDGHARLLAYQDAVTGVAFGDLCPDDPSEATIGLAACFLGAVRAAMGQIEPDRDFSQSEVLSVAATILGATARDGLR